MRPPACLALALAFAFLIGPPAAAREVRRAGPAMGTVVTLVAWTDDEDAAGRAFAAAFAEIERIEALLSTWRPDSEIARLNAAAGRAAVPLSAEVLGLLRRARRFSELTSGAFDVTVGAFAGVWRFDADRDGSLPEAAEVEDRRRLVDWRDLVLDGRRGTGRLRRAGQRVTLGGIGKGHAVDRVAATLRAHGLRHFVVQAGGDLYVAGRRGDRPWRVGLRAPRGAAGESFAEVEVGDRTVSTSGDYERFVDRDGRRYHHILDPATGYPATGCQSVTIVARDATTADALSTSVFVLGPRRGLALVERLEAVEAVIVAADGTVTVSSGLVRSPPFRLRLKSAAVPSPAP